MAARIRGFCCLIGRRFVDLDRRNISYLTCNRSSASKNSLPPKAPCWTSCGRGLSVPCPRRDRASGVHRVPAPTAVLPRANYFHARPLPLRRDAQSSPAPRPCAPGFLQRVISARRSFFAQSRKLCSRHEAQRPRASGHMSRRLNFRSQSLPCPVRCSASRSGLLHCRQGLHSREFESLSGKVRCRGCKS